MSTPSPAREALRAAILCQAEARAAREKAEQSFAQFEAHARDAANRAMDVEQRIAALRTERAQQLVEAGPGLPALRPYPPVLRKLRDEHAELSDEMLTTMAARDVLEEARDAAVSRELEAGVACAAARCRVEAEVATALAAEVRALEARAAELRRQLHAASTMRTISEPPLDLGAGWSEPPENADVRWVSPEASAQWRAFRVALLTDADAVLGAG